MPDDIINVMGPTFYEAKSLRPLRESLKPVEGHLGQRIVKQFVNTFNQFIDRFRTGKWAVEDQVCVKLQRDVSKMSRVILTHAQVLKANPTIEQAEADLKFRVLVDNRTEKIFDIMNEIHLKKGKVKGTELEKLVEKFETLRELNQAGMEHDHIIIDKAAKKPKGPFSEKISDEERHQMRLAKVHARTDLEAIEREHLRLSKQPIPLLRKGQIEREEKLLKELEEKKERRVRGSQASMEAIEKKKELSPQRAAHAFRIGIPDFITRAFKNNIKEHLTEAEIEKLESYQNEKTLNAAPPEELLKIMQEAIRLVNKGFFGLKRPLGPGLKMDINGAMKLGRLIDPTFMERKKKVGKAAKIEMDLITAAPEGKAVLILRKNIPRTLALLHKATLITGENILDVLPEKRRLQLKELSEKDYSLLNEQELRAIAYRAWPIIETAFMKAESDWFEDQAVIQELQSTLTAIAKELGVDIF